MNTDSTQTRLSLYHYPACPFCAYTRAAMKSLKLDVAQRDIAVNPGYRRELRQGGGKTQVPCLKIETGGQVKWLYESQDIVNFLSRHATAHRAKKGGKR